MGQKQLVYGSEDKGALLHGNVVNSLYASAHSFQRAALACNFQRHLQREQTSQVHTEEQNPSVWELLNHGLSQLWEHR